MATAIQDFTTEDMEYLRHGDDALMLRLYRPAGAGPFPVVIDLHGGAWTNGDLNGCKDRAEVLVASNLAVAALDFRQGGDGYLACMADINYATRWLKANAGELGLDAARVGIGGQSSGGHLAMLSAMRPRDERYAAIELDGAPSVDASVQCVGMAWPVINPLSRYRHALKSRAGAGPSEPADWVGAIPEYHDAYWGDEDTMAEGNPMLLLERGETVEMPPALWVQGRPDIVHDYRDLSSDATVNEPERFAANYRKAGGEMEIAYIDQATRATATSSDPLAAFFRRHLGASG